MEAHILLLKNIIGNGFGISVELHVSKTIPLRHTGPPYLYRKPLYIPSANPFHILDDELEVFEIKCSDSVEANIK